jgi:1-deoxy-D-xylulose-5-phosphate reductoisomerase
MEKLLLLGASGSIGEQTLAIIKNKRSAFSLLGFSVGRQVEKIPSILRDFPSVEHVYLIDEKKARVLQAKYPNVAFYFGEYGLAELVKNTDYTLMVNALVGFVGLEPTLLALGNDKKVALANKEALVVGGELIKRLLAQGKGALYPIDSEHVALTKCLQGQERSGVKRLILTASGGPFRTYSKAQLKNVTVAEALAHPSWSMGEKITIDSATMMNKGFEIIEAYYLFDFPLEQIDVVIHPESKVHALVEFQDGSFLADIGPTSMAIPIAYGLYQGQRPHQQYGSSLSFEEWKTWHFYPLDQKKFPAVKLAKTALSKGGIFPTVLNAANEVAVYAFLEGKIAFSDIIKLVEEALEVTDAIGPLSYQLIKEVDFATRAKVKEKIGI